MDVLLGKTLTELQEAALSVGLQKFAGKQLAEWLYVKRATSFDQMTNISLKGREAGCSGKGHLAHRLHAALLVSTG